MPTFLALRCFKCNTMQVKQEKKSTNKWTCSICNEKQSILRVFAASIAAKDIRSFVQNFNISRNTTKDRALAELVINEEEQEAYAFSFRDDVFPGEASEARGSILSNRFNHEEVTVENKWNEYLSQDEMISAEVAVNDEDDSFVTIIPEMCDTKRKRKIRPAFSKSEIGHVQKFYGNGEAGSAQLPQKEPLYLGRDSVDRFKVIEILRERVPKCAGTCVRQEKEEVIEQRSKWTKFMEPDETWTKGPKSPAAK